jgi:L-ascorbate metabolism protein UlaG (beta-lactamase superfamily)
MIRRIMLFVVLIILAVPVLFVTVGAYLSAPQYKGPVSDHFDGRKFINPGNVRPQGLREVLKWMLNRKRGEWKELKTEAYGKRPLDHEKENIRITFVNHSTFLIQVDGLNILTDPVWAKRTSPFSWAGPRRMRLPGIRFEDLPRIHAVLISHNHYDHLDLQTMRMVFGAHHPKIVTPLGVKAFLDGESIAGVTDLDWWQEIQLSDSVKVQAVPAQHFSGRGMLDRDATLWCGYVLKTSKGNIYFAGDTGYNDKTFREIGEKTGNMKVALLPIGAYKPSWFMSPVHTSPEEAVKIHFDVRSQNSIGTHFGTFPMADEGAEEPVADLRKALTKYNVNEEMFVALKEGEMKIIE